jgi:hypothetical protein
MPCLESMAPTPGMDSTALTMRSLDPRPPGPDAYQVAGALHLTSFSSRYDIGAAENIQHSDIGPLYFVQFEPQFEMVYDVVLF